MDLDAETESNGPAEQVIDLDHEARKRNATAHGFKEGASAGREHGAEAAAADGFATGAADGFTYGLARGVLHTLKSCNLHSNHSSLLQHIREALHKQHGEAENCLLDRQLAASILLQKHSGTSATTRDDDPSTVTSQLQQHSDVPAASCEHIDADCLRSACAAVPKVVQNCQLSSDAAAKGVETASPPS